MSGHYNDEPISRGAGRTNDGSDSTKPRLLWPDLVKAGTIIAVVVFHVHSKHYIELNWVALDEEPIRKAWTAFITALAPFRMPLFFAISGVLAASSLDRRWRLVAIRRIAAPYYLYLVWLIINATIYWILRYNGDYLLVRNIGDFLSRLWLPTSILWYLYALALYFLAARLLKRLPTAIVLAGAALLSAAVTVGLVEPPGMYESIFRNFVFYLIGAYFATWIKRAALDVGARQVGLALCLVVVVPTIYALGEHNNVFGARVVAGAAAIWAGVVSASLVSRWRRVPRGIAYIGRNTLPVFVMHGPLLALFSWLSAEPGQAIWTNMLENRLVLALYPGLLTVMIVALALAIYRLLLIKSHWLFRFPQRKRGVVLPRTRELEKRADSEVSSGNQG